MRVVILTSVRNGFASRCLPALCCSQSIEVVSVVLAHGVSPNRRSQRLRKLKKMLRIGPLGALNGLRVRPWFQDDEAEDIASVCAQYRVPLLESEFINCEHTRDLFREARADLGLSLGSGFISPSIFSIPTNGMINVHTEILPRYQGAQSVVWPIHDGGTKTGFCIHQIGNHIDTGDILYQATLPIQFCRRLEDTVRSNVRAVAALVPEAILHVCENFDGLNQSRRKQDRNRSYTTPSIWQFLRMVRNNRRLFLEQERRNSSTPGA